MNPLCSNEEHTLSRRQILGSFAAGSAGLGGLMTASVAEELRKSDKQVLFVWLDGGMSQLESWDPKPNTRFGGPFRAIPTSVPGIHISELLPRTAKLMHLLTVVRNMSTKDNSHSAGVPRMLRGDPANRGVDYPWFGSAVAKLFGSGKSGLPPYVWIKPGSGGFKSNTAGFLGPKHGALAFGDGLPPENFQMPDSMTPERDAARNALRERFSHRYAKNRLPRGNEANLHVFDMARTLMKRGRSLRHHPNSRSRPRSIRTLRVGSTHAGGEEHARGRGAVRSSDQLRLGHARRSFQWLFQSPSQIRQCLCLDHRGFAPAGNARSHPGCGDE